VTHAPNDPTHIVTDGWRNDGFYLVAKAPQFFPLAGAPVAWTPGTKGRVSGRVTIEPAQQSENADLSNTWLLRGSPLAVAPWWNAPARRLTDEELSRDDANVTTAGQSKRKLVGSYQRTSTDARGRALADIDADVSLEEWYRQRGVLGILQTAGPGHNSYVALGRPRRASDPEGLPEVVLAPESFNRLSRLVLAGVPITIDAEIDNVFVPSPRFFNVIADISGTDKADEVVMIGAHLDSVHIGTGATDNAAGCAMVLEAIRILRQIGQPMRRTVRVALWTGEEQGRLGSIAYLSDYMRGSPRDPRGRGIITAYFNVDNGTGRLRGVYLGGPSALAPVFRQWMRPLRHLGMRHLSTQTGGMTDHVSFRSAGIPAWQFIQDPIAYETLTHHTSLDHYEQLQLDDLRDGAIVLASFALFAANRDAPLTRP
jgi:hypothetical protein